MRLRSPAVLLAPLLLAASAPAAQVAEPADAALRQARAEQAAAEAETARLEQVASQAHDEAARLSAQQAAAEQGIEAAEARITAADMQFRSTSAYVAAHRQQLAQEQQPVSALLAGLATMAHRPPLIALADQGSADELVEVRVLLDSTLPVIRSRTKALEASLEQGRRLQQAALAARAEMARSRQQLTGRQRQFAALEQQAMHRALAAGGKALGTSDIAIAAGEDIEHLRSEEASNRSVRTIAVQLASDEMAPASPFRLSSNGRVARFAYELPAAAPVTEGLGAVDDSGVRSRGDTLSTPRGAALAAPADGTVLFSGPFRNYDGVLILDHGGGWKSLLVNVGSPLKRGDKVRLGDPIGRALGPIEVELSQNGRRFSPALIAGSSASLSNMGKGR
jgi:septal ring factor EnvC (AmiA/AmiB activator)